MTATIEAKAPTSTDFLPAPKALEPKVKQPHPWVGRMVYYWRITNHATHEVQAMPAQLIQPSPLAPDGVWDLNYFRFGRMDGRSKVRFSEVPKEGCWSWTNEEPSAPSEPIAPKAKAKGKRHDEQSTE